MPRSCITLAHLIRLALPALLLAACTVPREPLAVAEVTVPSLGLGAEPAPAIADGWWQALGDPQLDRLMTDALAGNPTLAAAMARLREAGSFLASAEADRRPQLTGEASVQAQRLSDAYIIPPPYGGSVRGIGQAQLNLSWDLDFWGRQAAAVSQAHATAAAAALDVDAARLALAGSVAQTYVELARAEQRLATAKAELEQREQALALVRLRVRGQLDGEREARGAEILQAQARQALALATAQREALVHACALLAGRGGDYYATLQPTRLAPGSSLPLPATLPADLLARRPDIVAAQARIDSAMAGREVARTAFYPDIDLMGLAGLQAIGLDRFISSDAATYGVGAAVHLPIFDGGQLRAAYAGASARADAAIADYNQAVLGAVRETADALSRVDSAAASLEAQRQATAASAGIRRIEDARLAAGLGSRLELIAAELQLLAAQQASADLEADQAIARIRLLLAVGGGFDPTHATPVTDTRPSP